MNSSSLKNVLLDFLFPITCVSCKRIGVYSVHLCGECAKTFPVSKDFLIFEAGGESALDGIYTYAQHIEHSPLAELIYRFKYDGAEEIVDILITFFPKTVPVTFLPAVFVPVPLHRRRKNMRGFNQSELLADRMSTRYGLPMSILLMRQRYTAPQVELKMRERIRNVADAFSMKNPKTILDNDVQYILVDDVATTGATLGECARVLKKHGARTVYGLVIAKARG